MELPRAIAKGVRDTVGLFNALFRRKRAADVPGTDLLREQGPAPLLRVARQLLTAGRSDRALSLLRAGVLRFPGVAEVSDLLATAVTGTGSTVLVGTRDRHLVARTAGEGTPLWKLPLDSPPVGSIEVEQERAYATTRDGAIFAVDLRDGTPTSLSAGHPEFRQAPQLVGEYLVTIDEEGEVLVSRASDGTPQWSYDCGTASGAPIYVDDDWIVIVDTTPKLHLLPMGN